LSGWSERDRKVIWHPFTQMKTADPPITIVKGKGVLLYDDAGNEYIDAVSSWWVNVHGHAHPWIQQKVNEQLGILEHSIFAGFTHPGAIELCERLIPKLPKGQERIFFSDNGSTAVEVGLKMALQYWWNKDINRHRIIAFEYAYHGDTVGAMSAGGRGTFTVPFDNILFDVEHIPVPNGTNNETVLRQFKDLCESGEVAAFIYEPVVQGAGGMVMYDIAGMDALLKVAKDHDVIRIADEVMAGFGRTGKLFASEHYATEPDIMALSKALTGGTMPLSLTTCKSFIYEAFLSDDKKKTFFHGHSYTGNPTACAAALASLDLFDQPELMENLSRINLKHQSFADRLKNVAIARNIRIRGTILAFEVETGEADTYFNSIRDVLYNSFIEQHILLRPLGNTVYILPPYVITDGQLEQVYTAILTTLDSLITSDNH